MFGGLDTLVLSATIVCMSLSYVSQTIFYMNEMIVLFSVKSFFHHAYTVTQ